VSWGRLSRSGQPSCQCSREIAAPSITTLADRNTKAELLLKPFSVRADNLVGNDTCIAHYIKERSNKAVESIDLLRLKMIGF
jgi:hypothetical protein